jgi:phosphoglycolate phosphatase
VTPTELLAQAQVLFLDFDGPVCDVFAGIASTVIAEQLRLVLADGGRIKFPDSIANSDDPFDILRYAVNLGRDEARYVETAFTAHEVEAIASAKPTDGAHDLIRMFHTSGRLVAIVSNNSESSIDAYLDLYGLSGSIDFVSARTGPDVALLKPNVYLLCRAMDALSVRPADCVFVGDSLTDIQAARSAQMRSIGYANKAGKVSRLARADAVAERISSLIS